MLPQGARVMDEITNKLLKQLEIAEYKIGEMLHFGAFEEDHKKNFAEMHGKIKNELKEIKETINEIGENNDKNN